MEDAGRHRRHMRRALRLAAEGQGLVEPNPMVGAVIVRDDRILAEGYHHRYGGPHAEVEAIEAASAGGDQLAGATLYVTLEPCVHYGKTPPCAPLVARGGLARVFAATRDPVWDKVGGPSPPPGGKGPGKPGMRYLADRGLDTHVGLCREEAVLLNAPFFKRAATGLPLVVAKWAMSADGKIATRTGASRWISCPESRHLVHRLRGRVDAIIVGSGTAELDDPLLTCRRGELRRTASRVVLCGERSLSAGSRLVRTAGEAPVVVAHPEGRPPRNAAELERADCELLGVPADGEEGRRVSPSALLGLLGERGASTVLLEGGRDVLGSFFDCGLVDRVMVFVAPFLIGGGDAATPVGGKGVDSMETAVGFLGPLGLAGNNQTPPGPRTNVRVVDRDLLIEGWLSDPLNWAP